MFKKIALMGLIVCAPAFGKFATSSKVTVAQYAKAPVEIRFAYALGVSDGLLAAQKLCIPSTVTGKQFMAVIDASIKEGMKDFGPAFSRTYVMPVVVGTLEAKWGCIAT